MIFTSVLPVSAENTTDISNINDESNVDIKLNDIINEDNSFVVENNPVIIKEDNTTQEEVFNDEKLNDLDFNSKRLLIASDYELNDEHVISSYDGLYLLQYESIDEAKQAYLFYLDKVEFVEPDIEVVATDDETPIIDSNEEQILTEQENAMGLNMG